MKTTVNIYQFERAFVDMNRNDNFSYEGKKALFEYLEQYEEDCGTEIELDVIALCCDYSEYASALEACAEVASEKFETEEEALEYLRDNTQVIEFDGGIIIQQF
jgi:hypothetical protein